MSEKGPKGKIFADYKLRNQTSKGKRKEKRKSILGGIKDEKRKKAMVAIMLVLQKLLWRFDRRGLFGSNVFKNLGRMYKHQMVYVN